MQDLPAPRVELLPNQAGVRPEFTVLKNRIPQTLRHVRENKTEPAFAISWASKLLTRFCTPRPREMKRPQALFR
jgi:hypothetical protein